MVKGEIKAVILDVDGTLTDDVSWLKLTNGLGGDSEVHQKIFDDFIAGKITYPQSRTQLTRLWRSTGNANKKFMSTMFEDWNLRKDAKKVVNYLKQKYIVCLISGAVDLHVEIVARKLDITDWYANTELIWDKKGNLVSYNYYKDQAEKKREHFYAFAKKFHLSKDNCVAIGNGDSDIALFRELKYGIAINAEPTAELEKLAIKKITKLSELLELL